MTKQMLGLAEGAGVEGNWGYGHVSPHVHLVEGGQHGGGVLSLLQPLGDPQPHPVHLHLSSEERRTGYKQDRTQT